MPLTVKEAILKLQNMPEDALLVCDIDDDGSLFPLLDIVNGYANFKTGYFSDDENDIQEDMNKVAYVLIGNNKCR